MHAEYPKKEKVPALHVVQLAAAPAAKEPGVHGVGTELAAGQACPAGHGFALAAVVPTGQKNLPDKTSLAIKCNKGNENIRT